MAVHHDDTRRPWPLPVRLVVGFVSLWVPLVSLALLTGWRDGGMPEAEPDSLLLEYVVSGSAVSGPLTAQLILSVLAFGVTRGGRLEKVATSALVLMGAAITTQGFLAAVGDHAHAPVLVGQIAGIGFLAFGLSLLVSSVRHLLAPGASRERETVGAR